MVWGGGGSVYGRAGGVEGEGVRIGARCPLRHYFWADGEEKVSLDDCTLLTQCCVVVLLCYIVGDAVLHYC